MKKFRQVGIFAVEEQYRSFLRGVKSRMDWAAAPNKICVIQNTIDRDFLYQRRSLFLLV